MLRINYVEDNRETRALIRKYLDQYAREHEPMEITGYENGKDFLSEHKPCDVLLLDIDMPGIDGMEVARYVRKEDKEVAIVFLTNMAEFAIRGYEVNAQDFVLKPIQYYGFALRLDRALERLQNRRSGRILLRLPETTKVVNTEDVYYIETSAKQLLYHTKQGVFPLRGSLRSTEEELKQYHFARCNQCYLVNLDYVTDVSGNIVTVCGTQLTISKRNKPAFLDALVHHIGGIR